MVSGVVLEGPRPLKSLKNLDFLYVFSMFFAFPLCSLMLALGLYFRSFWLHLKRLFARFSLQVGVLGHLLPPKSASWGGFRSPSWRPGGPLGVQVGLLVRLDLRGALLGQLWASKLNAKVGF